MLQHSIAEEHIAEADRAHELQRMSKMIDNLLFLPRTEHADHAIERKELLLADEFERMAEYFEGLADERNVGLVWRGDGCVWADALLLRRALANLLANAVRYADPGTTISTVAEQALDDTTIHVENRGPTIEPHHLERIFDHSAGVTRFTLVFPRGRS